MKRGKIHGYRFVYISNVGIVLREQTWKCPSCKKFYAIKHMNIFRHPLDTSQTLIGDFLDTSCTSCGRIRDSVQIENENENEKQKEKQKQKQIE